MTSPLQRRWSAGLLTAALVTSGLALSTPAMAVPAQPATHAPHATPAGAVPFVAPLAGAKKKTSITITKRTKAKTALGKKLSFSGKTSKSLSGKKVSLQIKAGNKWRTIKSAKVSSKRTFALSTKANKGGKQSYRVYAPATKNTAAAKSQTMKFTVWKWYHLSDLGSPSTQYTSFNERSIAGKTYRKAVSQGDGYNKQHVWADFNVNYKCTKFSSVIGMDDNSESGQSRSFYVNADGIRANFGSQGLGAPRTVSADISDSYRVRLGIVPPPGTGWRDGSGTFGNPKVFCSQKP